MTKVTTTLTALPQEARYDDAQPVLALRPVQAARAIGISPRKLWELTAGGQVPHVRLGRAVIYPVAALQAWLAQLAAGEGDTVSEASGDILLAAAVDYLRRGFSIVPVRFVKGRKQGAVKWKRYQTEAATDETIRQWFADGRYPGLAVVLGPVSGNLACRDFDKAKAYELWASQYPDLASTLPTVKTGRGYHVYFVAAVPKTVNMGDGELRGAKSLSVLPPSPHPNGNRYKWLVPLPDGLPPQIDPAPAGLAQPWAVTQKKTEEYRGRQNSEEEGEEKEEEEEKYKRVLEEFDPEISAAIEKTLPRGPGIRNRQVFQLARALKAIAQLAAWPAGRLRPVVERWHAQASRYATTEDFWETWADFIVAWPKVRVPMTLNFIHAIVEQARQHPVEGTEYPPKMVLLLSICRELQAAVGDAVFYISCRLTVKDLGAGHKTIARWLLILEADGWLKVHHKGSEKTMQATRFRFIDRSQANRRR